MKLTKQLLKQLEQSLCVDLTPEQRMIVLYWYGHEPLRYSWEDDDFVSGIRDVMRFYPDHRPKRLQENQCLNVRKNFAAAADHNCR